MKNQGDNSRRKFLKNSGAIAGITIIPSQSVWGACNASGISGGSKDLSVTCEVPSIAGGWSPGSWKKFTEKAACANYKSTKQKFKKIFGDFHSQSMRDNYINGLVRFIEITTVSYGDGSTVEKISFKLADVLDNEDTGDSKMDLAALYLNVKFGLASWDKVLNPTDEAVLQDFWGSMCVEHGYESQHASPRWTKPSGNMLTNRIVSQYWSDSSSSIIYGDTSKIWLNAPSIKC